MATSTYTYDNFGQLDYGFSRGYPDGGYYFMDFDNQNNQLWKTYTVQYNANNQELLRAIEWDAGYTIPLADGHGTEAISLDLNYYDYTGTQNWSQYTWHYDLNRNLTRTTIQYDNGSWVAHDIDTVGDQPWSTWTEYYIDRSRWSLTVAELRAGGREDTYNDPFNVQPWNTTVYNYDAANRLNWIRVNDDVGSALLTDYDQAGNETWTHFNRAWDTLGRWDWDLFYNDNGGRTFVDYNNTAVGDWANIVRLYSPAGTLTNTFVTYNNGTVVAS